MKAQLALRQTPDNRLTLYDTVKNSYASRGKQKDAFKSKGYVFDSDLSNRNEQVYFNPTDKKLLYSVKGTDITSLKDLGTDLYLAVGKLKHTNRYKEAKNVLQEAKAKYHPMETTLASHSLGGTISQYISDKNDKVFTLDKGATFGQKSRTNEKAYRTSGDPVSLLNAYSKNMTTLKNPTSTMYKNLTDIQSQGIFTTLAKNAFQAHDVDNIKNSNIYI